MARIENWNPITSRLTKLERVRADGVRIYSHRNPGVAGKFLAVAGPHDWAAFDTVEEAVGAVVS